ncbi:unnamed protein product, partial [Polarella glacialis]
MATPEAQRLYLKEKVDADLCYLWDENDLTLAHQYAIAQNYKTMRKFAALGDTRSDVRAAFVADHGLDPLAAAPAGAENRAAVSGMVCFWELAKDFVQRESQLRAEVKVLGGKRPASVNERQAMRRAVEATMGKLPAREVPHPDYVATKLEEVEQDEPMALTLDMVTHAEEQEVNELTSTLDASGRVQVTRSKVKGRLPSNSEEYRMKLRIEAHTWLMLAAKFRSKTWLVGLTAADFSRFTDYILGDKVLRMQIPDGHGEGHRLVDLNPPWGVVLSYEFQVRKLAFTLVRENGRTVSQGLEMAMKDTEVKEIFFTSAIALGGKRSSPPPPPGPFDNGRPKKMKFKEEKGKGDKKGRGKGKFTTKTPEGGNICFAFNTVAGCSTAGCSMAHVCQIVGCNLPHPYFMHKGKGKGKGTPKVEVPAQAVSDLRGCLEILQEEHNFVLVMKEVDLCCGQQSDVMDEKLWQGIMDSIEADAWSIVVVVPPCHTHSRARNAWRASPGPTPLRSRTWPRGFPWLRGDKLAQVQSVNVFVEKTVEACRGAAKAGSFFLTEHPEDLGIAADWDFPAAIWQLPEILSLATDTGAVTFAVHQCDNFGLGLATAGTSKPTRCLSTLPGAAKQPYQGWPCLHQSGVYAGPLPKFCGHKHFQLLGGDKANKGVFSTSAAASYPAAMCMMLALMIVECGLSKPQAPTSLLKEGEEPVAVVAAATRQEELAGTIEVMIVAAEEAAKAEAQVVQPAVLAPTVSLNNDSQEEPSSDEEPDGTLKPRPQDHRGGVGPPVQVDWGGKVRELCDGFGLCSPTRWHPKDRHARTPFTERLRETVLKHVNKWWPDAVKTVMHLAVGKEIHRPSGEEMGCLREDWFRLLPDPEMASKLPEYQPFFLHAMAQTADLQGDPDWRVLDRVKDSYAEGSTCGVPTKNSLVNESNFNAEMDNYSSAALAGDALRKNFTEEGKLGMMYETTLTLAKKQFKDRLRIAALGAIENSDDSFRILFDGTHGVKLNNDIRPRDQLDFPMGSDAGTQLAHSKEDMPGAHFTIAADVSKAHRRFKHAQRDWGLLICRDNSAANSDRVWVNRVGTFGVGSAAYWWGRLAGLIGRLNGRLLGGSYCWQSIFADDLVILAGGKDKWISILVTIAVWLMVGTPLAWHKFRGGLATDWVGYYLDMQTFAVGISLARAQWLTRWAGQVHQDGMADMRRFAEALGRMGFATHVLLWAKPFLAPLYAWSAAAPSEATIRVPKMIRLTLLFLEEQLKDGRHMLPCRKLWKDHGEWFRTDAKCDPDKVVLGGWICKDKTPTGKASWFSLTLTPCQVPWLFKADKGSSWASTSAELLATIVAVQAFDISCETGGTAVTRISAGTDNQANDKLSRKMSSTKMPLGLLLMQLATTLSARRLQLHLDWRPREENQEADDLTNNRYDAFDETKRVNISWNQVEKGLLEKLLLCQSEYEQELGNLKKRTAPATHRKGRDKRCKTEWA